MESVAHAAPNLNITVVRWSLAAPKTKKPRPWGGTSDGALAGFHLVAQAPRATLTIGFIIAKRNWRATEKPAPPERNIDRWAALD
jgi:hypothetical protein